MSRWQYSKGLHELGNGAYAWLLPDGGWGWSNAGLIADGGETLLVDTLFDLALTRDMLDGMRRAVPAAARIGTLVNSHANGDHTFGNQLVEGAQIIASRACLEEMQERRPEHLIAMERNWQSLGEGGAFFHEMMGSKFRWDDVVLALPTRTFEGELRLQVGGKEVRLISVGPAHTRGDIIVHVPQDRLVFAGDILFIGGHPIVWAGPCSNWIKACDLMLGWDIETVVPGHGPITDKAGIRRFRDYLDYLLRETRRRYDAGLTYVEAAYDIALDAYADWIDTERIVINTASLYREFSGATERRETVELFGEASRYRKARHGRAAP